MMVFEKKKNLLSYYVVILLVSVICILTACNKEPVENKKQEQKMQTEQIKVTNIDWINGPPQLQKKSGIYFFTKENHPRELEKAFDYSSSNGWLIQLDPEKHAKFKGHSMKVLSVNRTDTPKSFNVIVQMTPGGNSTKPPYCFFEATKKELPTSARLIVETSDKEVLIN